MKLRYIYVEIRKMTSVLPLKLPIFMYIENNSPCLLTLENAVIELCKLYFQIIREINAA